MQEIGPYPENMTFPTLFLLDTTIIYYVTIFKMYEFNYHIIFN